MGDLISRQAAIDALDKECRCTDKSDDWDGLEMAMLIIENLPPAQSDNGYSDGFTDGYKRGLTDAHEPEPQWILCNERLPEEYGEYICTLENGQVQECGFVPEKQKGLITGWSTCEADGHKFLRNKDVLAWMPLPEPYMEEGD